MKKTTAFLVAALAMCAASPAMALGLKYGARLGYGMGMPDPSKGVDSASVMDVGLGVQLDLAIVGIEVDALYNRQTITPKGGGGDSVTGNIALPILGRFSLPVIPLLLSLDFGAGLEPRFPISATVDGKDKPTGIPGAKAYKEGLTAMPLYLPILIGATLDLHFITANLDLRYERDLTQLNKKGSAVKNHEFVAMAGVFF